MGTLLSICINFFLVFLKFLLILILYKLDNSYIFPLGKTVVHRLFEYNACYTRAISS